jgi:hypothetical protein
MVPQQNQVEVETNKDNARLEGLAMFIGADVNQIKSAVDMIIASGGTKLSKEEFIKQLTNGTRDLGKDKATAMKEAAQKGSNLSREELLNKLVSMMK